MHLEKLELKGFKSFKDKTVLEFPDNFTGVIGPNGSGKSNITEAICFVLGKSRGLRAGSLQELIFNGGVSGTPAEKAVVTITLKDNSGKRYRLTRIVERDGHSTYKLDDERVTRQRIIDLVGDNEYNIILQDDVTKVIDMKPQDRRRIIDDLCGIGEYDDKRDKALKEIEKVEKKIGETHIILGEKQGYMNELKKERDEAVRYQGVRDEVRKCKATLLSKDINSLERRNEKLDEQMAETKRAREEGLGRIGGLRGKIAETNNLLKDVNAKIREIEGGQTGAKIAEVKGEIKRFNDKITVLTDRVASIELEQKARKEKRRGLLDEQRRIAEELTKLDMAVSVLKKDVEREASRGVDLTVENVIDESKSMVYDLKSQMKLLDDINQKNEAERAKLLEERSGLEGRVKDWVGLEQGKSSEVGKLEQEYHKAESDFKGFEREYDIANGLVDESQKGLESLRILLSEKQSELRTLERTTHGLKDAVKAVMNLKKVIPGIHGPVSTLGTVADKNYELALNIAAGGRMENIVVDSVDVAAKCIEYLREKQIGRCTFLPLEKLNVKVDDRKPEGSVGFARDFIKTDRKFRHVFDYVFMDTLVVKDIATAKKIGIGGWRIVTLDGDLLEKSGAMTGGFIKKRFEVTFSNFEELESEISGVEAKLAVAEEDYGMKLEARKKLDSRLMLVRNQLREAKERLDSAMFERNLLSEKKSGVKDRLAQITSRLSEVDKEISENAVKKTTVEKTFNVEERKLKGMVESRGEGAVATKIDEIKDTIRNREIERTRLSERSDFITQQVGEIEARGKVLEADGSQSAGALDSAKESLRGLESELRRLEREASTMSDELKRLVGSRDQHESDLTSYSAGIAETEKGIEDMSGRMSEFVIEKTKNDTRLEELRREFKNYEGVELLEKSLKDLSEDVEKLEKQLLEFGTVNMKAIETYDIVKKEYDDISGKLDTLRSERQSIFDFMDKIEKKKRESFMEAFEVVKRNFEDIYAKLADGKGTLVLDNPMSVSESGLIIRASPGGKKVMSLDSMSGGEKVLTSAAFLLSVQQYKPSYFYIVDELDAALDKANSVKLAQMLKASDAQFIMVTHNNAMMKYMGSAIGVSMVSGVSQIVGVKFNTVEDAPSQSTLEDLPPKAG